MGRGAVGGSRWAGKEMNDRANSVNKSDKMRMPRRKDWVEWKLKFWRHVIYGNTTAIRKNPFYQPAKKRQETIVMKAFTLSASVGSLSFYKLNQSHSFMISVRPIPCSVTGRYIYLSSVPTTLSPTPVTAVSDRG